METKWFSKEALQIAEEKCEVKGKGERGKYTQLLYRRIARREKKAFASELFKEI